FFFRVLRMHLRCPLFPYTTLFRSPASPDGGVPRRAYVFRNDTKNGYRAMAQRQLKLGAFMRPISIHTGAWRYPGAWPDANFNFGDRKSTRLNSSHDQISYAVFCLK